jgi:hypothetical protein
MMFSSNNCRFTLFFLLSLSANAETLRGAQRELQTSEIAITPKVLIGTAGNYAILAKAGISSISSVIIGDIGVSPIAATAMTGFGFSADASGQFATSTQLPGGKAYASDYGGPTSVALTTAVSDMETAYTDAAGRITSFEKLNLESGILGGETTFELTTGVYTFGSSVTIGPEGIIFKGSATDIFIIQISNDMVVEKNVKVTLEDGVLAENIFWQVAGKVVVKAGAEMKGVLLVKTAITFEANSSLNGRVLTQTRCNLDQATISAD